MTLPTSTTIIALNERNTAPFFYPNDAVVDQFIRKIIFEPMEMSTEAFEYARATSNLSTAFFSRDGTLPNNATNVESFSETFYRLGDHIQMDLLEQETSRGTDQFEQQVYGTKLGILRTLSDALINGATVGNPHPFIGLTKQVLNGNGINLGSVTLTLQQLYKAVMSSTPTDGFIGAGADCLVTSNEGFRQILYLLDQAGEALDWSYDKEFDVEIPIVCGLPLYIDDSVEFAEGRTALFVLKIRGDTAIRILYAKSPDVECDRFGIHTFDLPLEESKNNLSRSVEGFYTLHVPEVSVIVMIQRFGVPNIA